MAAGAGLPVLALVVTGLHFVVVLGYTPLCRRISRRGHAEHDYLVTYEDGRGVLRDLLTTCTGNSWSVGFLSVVGGRGGTDALLTEPDAGPPLVTVSLALSGPGVGDAVRILGAVDGVVRVDRSETDDE